MNTFVGWVLIAGFLLFITGAARWRLAYEGPLAESLPLVHRDHRRRNWIHTWMSAALVVTPAGLAGFLAIQSEEKPRVLAAMAFTVYTIGAVCLLCSVLFRMTVGAWAAEQTTRTGTVPPLFPPLNAWAGWLYGVHMLASYAAFAVLGAAVLASDLPTWLGWLGVGLGVGCLVGLVGTRFAGPFSPPILAHLYPAILGVVLLF